MNRVLYGTTKFKNILCYCSTKIRRYLKELPDNLKTSYVIVQLAVFAADSDLLTFKNILCYCSTVFCAVRQGGMIKFKNILCYCSTALCKHVSSLSSNLKTSYVIVQPPVHPVWQESVRI